MKPHTTQTRPRNEYSNNQKRKDFFFLDPSHKTPSQVHIPIPIRPRNEIQITKKKGFFFMTQSIKPPHKFKF